MIDIMGLEQCCGCSACANACPKQCITLHVDKKGFLYPQFDTGLCIQCNLCEKVCPFINKAKILFPISVEAVRSKSPEEVLLSSSGGVCHELSHYFIDNGGVVYGAAWSDDWVVKHIRVTDKSDLEKIRCSKYLQSQMGDIFKNVKTDLTDSKNVLFIGTPCQVAGLKCYLRKNFGNLTTVDFVCHGVPSQSVFNRTIADIENRRRSKIVGVNFRSKRESWREFGIEFHLKNGDNLYVRHSKSFFFRGFMSNLYLRDSCYKCPFTNNRNCSDITVADLWGVECVRPEIDDNSGLNLVMVRSLHGQKLLEHCSNRFDRFQYNYHDALKYNPAIEIPPKVHPLSGFYWRYLTKLPIRLGITLTLLGGRILRCLKIKR